MEAEALARALWHESLADPGAPARALGTRYDALLAGLRRLAAHGLPLEPALGDALAAHPGSIDLALIAARAQPDADRLASLAARIARQNRRRAALAWLMWDLGRPDDALAALRRIDPASDTARTDRAARAELTLMTGGTPEALPEPGPEGERLALMTIWHRQGAAALTERLGAMDRPGLPWLWLIEVFVTERDFARARQALAGAERAQGADHPAVRTARIRLALDADDPATARALLALEGQAGTPWLWSPQRLALTLRWMIAEPDHLEAAALPELARRALRLYPGHAGLRALARAAHEGTGDWDRLAEALQTDPQDPLAAARGLLRLGLPEAALTALADATDARPEARTRARLRGAEIRLRMGDLTGAEAALGPCPESRPLAADHAWWTAEIALARRDIAAARAALTPALRHAPTRMGLWLSAARAEFLAGDSAQARRALDRFRALKTAQRGADPGDDLRDLLIADAARDGDTARAARTLALATPGFTPVAGAIPRQIAHYWEGPRSAPVNRGIRAWAMLHPGHAQTVFDAGSAAAWLDRHAPGLTALFQRQSLPATRADLFRLAWVLHEGGIFADLDEYPRAPVTPWLEGARAVLVIEEGHGTVANNFLAAEPGLPLFARTLDTVARTLAETEAPYPWWHSGPAPLTVQALAASRDAGESAGLRFLTQPDYDARVATNLPFPHKRGALHWR